VTEVFLTVTEVFPCFSLSCKANATVKLVNTGHHSSTLICICVVRLLFVLFYVLFVCKYVLTTGDNPTAVNKYIISNPMSGKMRIYLKVVEVTRVTSLNHTIIER
jgi:hypothetical protein